MIVLQLISSAGLYGAEHMIIGLCESLRSLHRHAVMGVFCDARHSGCDMGAFAQQLGLTVRFVPCGGRFDVRTVGAIEAALDECGADVLHTHGYKADLYGLAAAWRRPVALVSTCHNWLGHSVRTRLYEAADRRALRYFDYVTTPSPSVADRLRRSGVPAPRIRCIDNGVVVTRFEAAMPTLRREIGDGHGKLVGCVARLEPAKGGEVLVRAARQVLAACPDTTFVFVGDGTARVSWERLSSELGIAERVMFAGARTDMPGVYASLDLVVLPSFDEAMPMCLLEAMAAERPVIATRVGAIPKLISHEQTGLLIEPGDVGALAASITRLLTDQSMASCMARRGHDHVAEGFSSHVMAERYVTTYEAAVERRAASSRPEKSASAVWP